MGMHDENGATIGFVKIFRDQTANLRTKEALEKGRQEVWNALQEAKDARAKAEVAGEAKRHFLAVLSHELRTPLTPISILVQTLMRMDLPERVHQALSMIQRNVEIESRLVDDLLDVTRIEQGKLELAFETTQMHQVIQSAVEVMKSEIEQRQQQLTLVLEATEHSLYGDPHRLQQVVWNLLKNASKFTPDGGKIRIYSRNESGVFIVEISDTGIGIDAEALPRIIEAFTQADASITRQYGGLGLGLAIARAIVEAHKGNLRAESDGKDCGAKFTVTLPLGLKT